MAACGTRSPCRMDWGLSMRHSLWSAANMRHMHPLCLLISYAWEVVTQHHTWSVLGNALPGNSTMLLFGP